MNPIKTTDRLALTTMSSGDLLGQAVLEPTSFAGILDDDLGEVDNSLMDLFLLHQQFELYTKIIDHGLAYLFQTQLKQTNKNNDLNLHEMTLNHFPIHIRHIINYNANLRYQDQQIQHRKTSPSLQTLKCDEIRKKVHSLPLSEFKDLIDQLPMDIYTQILGIGLKNYEQDISQSLLHAIIETLCKHLSISPLPRHKIMNINHVLVYGYCRSNLNQINELFPVEILDLCYQFYFIMFIANNQMDIDRECGISFNVISRDIQQKIRWDNIENKFKDCWDQNASNAKMRIHSKNQYRISRFECEHQMNDKTIEEALTTGLVSYNIFGTETISLGQKKVWRIKITPKIANIVIGICDSTAIETGCDGRSFISKYDSFGLSLDEQILYDNEDNYWDFAFKSPIDVKEERSHTITMELDIKEVGNCGLRYYINDDQWKAILDPEIDATKSYKLAISVSDSQTIELLHDHYDTEYKLGPIYLHQWIDCQFQYKWYEAQIIEISESDPNDFKVRYKSKWVINEWIRSRQEPFRVRPLHTFTDKPSKVGELQIFDIGTKCDFLNRDNEWYKAEIIEHNDNGELIKIQYRKRVYGRKFLAWINKDSYRLAPLHTMSSKQDFSPPILPCNDFYASSRLKLGGTRKTIPKKPEEFLEFMLKTRMVKQYTIHHGRAKCIKELKRRQELLELQRKYTVNMATNSALLNDKNKFRYHQKSPKLSKNYRMNRTYQYNRW